MLTRREWLLGLGALIITPEPVRRYWPGWAPAPTMLQGDAWIDNGRLWVFKDDRLWLVGATRATSPFPLPGILYSRPARLPYAHGHRSTL